MHRSEPGCYPAAAAMYQSRGRHCWVGEDKHANVRETQNKNELLLPVLLANLCNRWLEMCPQFSTRFHPGNAHEKEP